ncbi:transglutaminase domain-containing protein [Bradyrhizobium sp. ISRA443]|uniref:transglutaminase domain-containing protein n=1 Tax=unclassified Bradyrhizobium TaxID=2631580 RepID=UPI00247A30BE|nr:MULTISPECIES: transglutaminase domain-containing protein [unclassified Bradyrhizobium]WGR93079.1 transglutaminase domain-containing protein [Bradyrhizobium sp. ISRA435]WGR97582.1 transglutaminase domain-containing protein [Bradyrhizobium sp. ISRA436]WGS04472.1 transglutaminase domain-containing protein [Bradyrhizobium sp. ISRA437]WGS11353.1 transglutaminase domain-containing protein [Bradyrhizobium sp. ISRA443]
MSESSYATFLRRYVKDEKTELADLYHAVRNIPYGSVGDRDPVKVITNNVGSCSGKHILLRDLLRQTGHDAEIITIFAHFNRGVPSHPSMPADLRVMIEGDPVCDFHHYLRVLEDQHWLKLDATWHDALMPFGFPVNRNWPGTGDTVLAATPIREYPAVEDLAARKAELLAQLSQAEREKRTRFFERLTGWMATL